MLDMCSATEKHPSSILKILIVLAQVAQICNPSYSRGRDQEDYSSRPAWANSSQDLISKKHKKGLVEWFKV
jgi:hypothetical protein